MRRGRLADDRKDDDADKRSSGHLPLSRCGARKPFHLGIMPAQSGPLQKRTVCSCMLIKTDTLCRALADKIRPATAGDIDYVVGPAIGGLIPAYETSRHLKVPVIWVECEQGTFRLCRFEIEKGARVVTSRASSPPASRSGRLSNACAHLASKLVPQYASSIVRPARPTLTCR